MTGHGRDSAGCIVVGCAGASESHLGVCAAHWWKLTPELRTEWWDAWHYDGRVKRWGAVRKACVEYLAAHDG